MIECSVKGDGVSEACDDIPIACGPKIALLLLTLQSPGGEGGEEEEGLECGDGLTLCQAIILGSGQVERG